MDHTGEDVEKVGGRGVGGEGIGRGVGIMANAKGVSTCIFCLVLTGIVPCNNQPVGSGGGQRLLNPRPLVFSSCN